MLLFIEHCRSRGDKFIDLEEDFYSILIFVQMTWRLQFHVLMNLVHALDVKFRGRELGLSVEDGIELRLNLETVDSWGYLEQLNSCRLRRRSLGYTHTSHWQILKPEVTSFFGELAGSNASQTESHHK